MKKYLTWTFAGAAILGASWYLVKKFKNPKPSRSDDNTIVLGIDSFIGNLPLIYLNGGTEPSEDSLIYRKYGLKLELIIQDCPSTRCDLLSTGKVDIISEAGDYLSRPRLKLIAVSGKSIGADAVVSRSGKVGYSDILGKIIACSRLDPGYSVLLSFLGSIGVPESWLNFGNYDPKKINIKFVHSPLDAASQFKEGLCDIAVVSSPSLEELQRTTNLEILRISESEDDLIRGLYSTESWLSENSEKARVLDAARFVASVELKRSPEVRAEALRVFSEVFQVEYPYVQEAASKVDF